MSPLQKRDSKAQTSHLLPSTFSSFLKAPICLLIFVFPIFSIFSVFSSTPKGQVVPVLSFLLLSRGLHHFRHASFFALLTRFGRFPYFCSEPVQGCMLKGKRCQDTTWAWFKMIRDRSISSEIFFKYINVHLWLQIIGKSQVDTQPRIAGIENLSFHPLHPLGLESVRVYK